MPQDARAQHRREREREEARNENRAGERERELDEQPAGAAGGERHRRVHGSERERHRHDRETHLAHAAERRLHRLHAFLDVAVDVLEHDDRIVDDQPDRQHEREESERVDREAGGEHQRAHADQADRNRDQRNEARAHRAEEQEDHRGHQHRRLEDRPVHRLDRTLDEQRVVVGDVDGEALGQLLAQARQLGLERLRERQRIGGGLLDQAERDRVATVEAHDAALVLRGERDAADVADAHRVAVDVAHDDVLELGDALQVRLRDDGEFALAALDAPRRQFDVLPPQRVLDVLRREREAGQPVGGEPHAHRELALAEDAHVGRARQRLQARLHEPVGDVGNLERRQRHAREGQPDDRVRVGLDLGDHRLVDRVGQLRAHARDAVAHVGRCAVRIALEAEAHGDLALLGARDRREHVDSLDAGDRILERLGDLRLDDVGRRAQVFRRDGDRRLVDLRVFAHLQPRIRNEPEQQDDQRQHRGEHGPPDADIRYAHAISAGSSPSRPSAEARRCAPRCPPEPASAVRR